MFHKLFYSYILILTLTGCQSLSDNEVYAYKEQTLPLSKPEPNSSLQFTKKLSSSKKQNPLTPIPIKRQLPHITQEPIIAVFLAQGQQISLNLPRGGIINNSEHQTISIPSGTLRATITNNGITTNVTGDQPFEQLNIQVHPISGKPTFSTKVYPPFGETKVLNLSGQPKVVIDPNTGELILVERVGLETYLSGVLPTEINPSWPLEAIKAQAVAARSYTMDRYLTRLDQPWQLHWHFTVDMAYGGLIPLNSRMQTALKQTNGQLLVARGLPVPALFHACSGGQTESAINFRPNLVGADNFTPMADVMPSVADPYAISAAKSLNSPKYINWQAQLSIAEINKQLHKWSYQHPEDNIPEGEIESVRVGKEFSDSGRIASVIIRHTIDGNETETIMSAATFRLAVSPMKIRSTYWKHFAMDTNSSDTLIIKGSGFGHGVGLSQISAYQMAKEGKTASDIMRHFYPGAKLAKWW